MKTFYIKLKKYSKKLFARKAVVQKTRRSTRDWLLGLSSATLLAFVFCCVGVYFFFVFLGSSSLEVEQGEVENVTFDRALLMDTVKLHSKENETFETLRQSAPEIPSTGNVEVVTKIVGTEEEPEEGSGEEIYPD